MRASLASITRCSLASGAVRFAALVPHVLPAPLSGVTRVVGAPCSLSRGPVACALSHATRSLVWWRMGFVCSPLVRFALLALLACCLRSFARRPACLVSQEMLAPLVVSCVCCWRFGLLASLACCWRSLARRGSARSRACGIAPVSRQVDTSVARTSLAGASARPPDLPIRSTRAGRGT